MRIIFLLLLITIIFFGCIAEPVDSDNPESGSITGNITKEVNQSEVDNSFPPMPPDY